MSEQPRPVDQARVEALCKQFLDVVQVHYLAGPTHPDRVLEILNALAIVVAYVIRGADDRTLEFFNDALEQQIDRLLLQSDLR